MSLLMSSSCCPLNCYLVSIAPNRHEFDGRPGRARVQSSPAAAALSQIQQPAGQLRHAFLWEHGVISDLEQKPLLRIYRLGLTRADAEELGIESVDLI